MIEQIEPVTEIGMRELGANLYKKGLIHDLNRYERNKLTLLRRNSG